MAGEIGCFVLTLLFLSSKPSERMCGTRMTNSASRQILVHRPFIPTPRRPACAGFPSLAICSNASRAISNILDVVLRRGRQASPVPGTCVPVALLMPAFTAAVVLLIGVWGGRKPGGTADSERAMQDVKKCLRGMKEMESTWRQAGKIA